MKFILQIIMVLLLLFFLFSLPLLLFVWNTYYTEHVCEMDNQCISPDYNAWMCYNFTGAIANNPNKKTLEGFKYTHSSCQCSNYIITKLCNKK